MLRRLMLAAVSVSLPAVLFSPCAAAQVLYGCIVGTITDQSGAVIPRAHVTVRDRATGEARDTTTDDAGRYAVANLPGATYEITITATGFRTYQQSNVTAIINNVTRVDVQLQVGAETQQLLVTASSAVLQTDKADVRRRGGGYRHHEIRHQPATRRRLLLLG